MDVQQVRQVLEHERWELLHSLTEQDLLLQGQENLDENDLADLFESQEIQSRLDELSKRKLGSITSALDRLNRGTYGICSVCREEIPADRLAALPYAELCIPCQERMEKKGK